MSAPPSGGRKVALVTLGCARNEVDSEELAGRLAAEGWELSDTDDADVVMVNTCGFVEQAKKDSVDTLLAASDTGAKVVAVGCLAERYGNQLAESLPEADAVLGFDDYDDIAARLQSILGGAPHVPHAPRDRRELLPISPVERPAAVDSSVGIPGHAGGPTVLRKRLERGPVAPLKLASGCDRRCSFCAIPSFRGSFVSRRPADVLTEARWLAADGVRELVLVSENSTSYGKDLGDPRLLETLVRDLAAVPGIVRVRVSYLQPAETRPSLVETIGATPRVAPYFDLSFQHASEPVLRRMRRFGSTERFVELLASARALTPDAGARSNFIVGFPGETEEDVAELERFLTAARLDAVGVFAYSDEDGTEAAGLPGKLPAEEIARRYERIWQLAEELTAQRAEERVGSTVEVLVEDVDGDVAEGRAAHQAPEVDGTTTVYGHGMRVGDLVRATVTGSEGVDLVAELTEVLDRPGPDGSP
jgi:ribosomal protein S12 methylthiotransferase RimO